MQSYQHLHRHPDRDQAGSSFTLSRFRLFAFRKITAQVEDKVDKDKTSQSEGHTRTLISCNRRRWAAVQRQRKRVRASIVYCCIYPLAYSLASSVVSSSGCSTYFLFLLCACTQPVSTAYMLQNLSSSTEPLHQSHIRVTMSMVT